MIVRPLTRGLNQPINRSLLGNRLAGDPLTAAVKAALAGGELGGWYASGDTSTLFQDAAMTTPVTADGDRVGAIKDKSGNGNHFTQSNSSLRPTYKVVNGRGRVRFNGTDQYMVVASSKGKFKFLHDGTGGCAFAAVSLTSPLTASKVYPIFGTGPGSVANVGMNLVLAEAVATAEESQQQRQTIANGTAAVINGTSNGQGSARGDGLGQVFGYTYKTQTGSDFRMYCDGDNFNLARAESVTPSSADATQDLRLGNAYGTDYLAGDFMGAVLFNREPAATERQNVINYLRSQYGDSGHILGVGDSHTYNTAYGVYMRGFYPALVESALRDSDRPYTSLNYGVSGNTTANIISRISSVLEHGAPFAAIVYAGQNDSAIDTEANLESIVASIKAAGCPRVLVCGSHFMNFASGGDTTDTEDAGWAALRAKQSAAAKDAGVPYVDLYAWMRQLILDGTYEAGDDTAWHVDVGNTHLNATGQQIIADAMYAAMQEQGWA